MRPARPLSTLHEKFVLPRESATYMLALGSDIPYFYCVIEPMLTTQGSGTDVQGESLKGVRPVPRVTGDQSLRRFLSADPREIRRSINPQRMEHKVPTSIIGDSAGFQDSNHDSVRNDSAPDFFGRASIVADHGLLTLLAH